MRFFRALSYCAFARVFRRALSFRRSGGIAVRRVCGSVRRPRTNGTICPSIRRACAVCRVLCSLARIPAFCGIAGGVRRFSLARKACIRKRLVKPFYIRGSRSLFYASANRNQPHRAIGCGIAAYPLLRASHCAFSQCACACPLVLFISCGRVKDGCTPIILSIPHLIILLRTDCLFCCA